MAHDERCLANEPGEPATPQAAEVRPRREAVDAGEIAVGRVAPARGKTRERQSACSCDDRRLQPAPPSGKAKAQRDPRGERAITRAQRPCERFAHARQVMDMLMAIDKIGRRLHHAVIAIKLALDAALERGALELAEKGGAHQRRQGARQA